MFVYLKQCLYLAETNVVRNTFHNRLFLSSLINRYNEADGLIAFVKESVTDLITDSECFRDWRYWLECLQDPRQKRIDQKLQGKDSGFVQNKVRD